MHILSECILDSCMIVVSVFSLRCYFSAQHLAFSPFRIRLHALCAQVSTLYFQFISYLRLSNIG